jgi:hypothetical protein
VTAVKILNELDSTALARFDREIEILKRLAHPHVVKFIEAGVSDGHHWYESEFAPRGDFGRQAPYILWSDLSKVNYFIQICRGVQALHDARPRLIIHRDLKPSNILVFDPPEGSSDFVLKIADFGASAIAGDAMRLTRSSDFLGTEEYIAPECRSNPHNQRPSADIYSLGISFIEACTGSTAPTAENLLGVPALMRPVIEKMIRRHPDDRQQSVGDVQRELDALPKLQLLLGRQPYSDEIFASIYGLEAAGEIDRAWEALIASSRETVAERLRTFEYTLDRVGQNYDHVADAIMRTTGPVLQLIEADNPQALERLVGRFLFSAEKTKDDDECGPVPDMWSHFLFDAFRFSSTSWTKRLCLEGLVTCWIRFATYWPARYLLLAITGIESPDLIEHLAIVLRERQCEIAASLLDGVPDDRDLDVVAIGSALGLPNRTY